MLAWQTKFRTEKKTQIVSFAKRTTTKFAIIEQTRVHTNCESCKTFPPKLPILFNPSAAAWPWSFPRTPATGPRLRSPPRTPRSLSGGFWRRSGTCPREPSAPPACTPSGGAGRGGGGRGAWSCTGTRDPASSAAPWSSRKSPPSRTRRRLSPRRRRHRGA